MSESSEDTQLCRAALERQYVTEQELQTASDHRSQLVNNGRPRPLGDILVDLGFLTRTQLGRLQGGNDESGNRPAQQIPGYQLQKKVGAGAMAVVYRAKQISLDRTVAVKVLPKRLSQNPEFVQRFYREGRAAAKLNHNNIVQAIDVGEAGGFHYFVMEFVEGCTVYDELAGGNIYGEVEAINIIRQIAEALQHAHERGFIHRDVKPKNIMLTPERVAKLADMGLARETTDLEAAMAEAGRAYGTPYYISPEQIRGEVDIDHRADLYSLGGTFYHMVTGRVPFEGPTPAAVMHKHLKEEVTPPDHLNTKLTAGCGAMIEKLMAKSRDQRYSSATDLLVDLKLLSEGKAPKYASQKLDSDAMATLSQGESIDDYPRPHHVRSTGGGTSNLTILLWVLFGVSALLNLILLIVFATK
ncbi:MAG: serine/threonine-protein kinase [Phycisphaerae bacterium]